MLRDQQVLDDASAYKMFLNDPFECGWIAPSIPGAFRVHHRNRSAFADTKAVDLRAKNSSLLGKSELSEPAFQILPSGDSAFQVAALRFGLLGAEENMATRDRYADGRRDFLLGF